ncbi:MAG TPA: hypothetical protein VFK05_19325 [Polyangiaceae bacterium]|nr:hypothetical protein [Polyangiaceae bacterium]
MKSRLPLVFSLLLALAVSACNEQRSERVAASYSSAAKRDARPFREPPQPQRPPSGLDAVPVEEDYEARAAANITEANLEAKLAELERELRW